jgi:hypothetical protein
MPPEEPLEELKAIEAALAALVVANLGTTCAEFAGVGLRGHQRHRPLRMEFR